MNQLFIKSILDYEPSTGKFTWKLGGKGTKGRGSEAGTVTAKGYKDVCIHGRKYGLHRLAFLYMTGAVPDCVDHVNGIKQDNRWCNLRPATIRDNSLNQKKRNSKSGYKNVYYDPRGIKNWYGIVFDRAGKLHRTVYCSSPEEADVLTKKLRETFQGGFLNHG